MATYDSRIEAIVNRKTPFGANVESKRTDWLLNVFSQLKQFVRELPKFSVNPVILEISGSKMTVEVQISLVNQTARTKDGSWILLIGDSHGDLVYKELFR